LFPLHSKITTALYILPHMWAAEHIQSAPMHPVETTGCMGEEVTQTQTLTAPYWYCWK